jgi:hypothetical protein
VGSNQNGAGNGSLHCTVNALLSVNRIKTVMNEPMEYVAALAKYLRFKEVYLHGARELTQIPHIRGPWRGNERVLR